MQLPHYPIEASSRGYRFEFDSIGPKDRIPKLVMFTEIGPGLYNLGFGDKLLDGEIDDQVVSDNGDPDKVLGTIVTIVQDFLAMNPQVIIYAEGSTPSRIRRYQMGINQYRLWMDREIAIFGSNATGDWEAFTPGRNYAALAATKRT